MKDLPGFASVYSRANRARFKARKQTADDGLQRSLSRPARTSHTRQQIHLDKDNGANTTMGELISSRNDLRDVRCQRLLFRCWHRGTQESDLILGPFAERSLANLDTPSSTDSKRCSIAPTPICSIGFSAAALRRQNMITM